MSLIYKATTKMPPSSSLHELKEEFKLFYHKLSKYRH